MNGLLLLDKPAGVTSNNALQQVKRLFNAAKAGHTGSLDPLATGLLPICFGEATKVSQYLLDADKVYRAEILLGVTTDTGDSEGEVREQAPVDVDLSRLEGVLEEFRGGFMQMPPMYSALKHNGQPLYKLARKGIEVERKPRPVTVYDLDLESFDGRVLKLKMRCSSGFYVRTLAQDIGAGLGCGGHVSALRRLAVGRLDIQDSVTIDTLQLCDDATQRYRHINQCDTGLGHLPRIDLSADGAFYLCRGEAVRAAPPSHPEEPEPGRDGTGAVRLYARGAGFLGIGELLDDGRVAPRRLFNRA